MAQDETDFLNPYRLLRREDGSLWTLHAGRIWTVYKARHTLLEQDVALRIIDPSYVVPRTAEALAWAYHGFGAKQFTGIADVLEVRAEDGKLLVIEEFVPGESLAQIVERSGPLSVAEALSLTEEAAAALETAHCAGWIHGGIAPENLLRTRGSETAGVKMTGFGLRRILASAAPLWANSTDFETGYASPEQIAGQMPDPRSDVYSLGKVLGFALGGTHELVGNAAGLAVAGVPSEVGELLRRMLAADPAQRPQSAGEVARMLKSLSGAREIKPAATDDSLLLRATKLAADGVMPPPSSTPAFDSPVGGTRPPRAGCGKWIALTCVVGVGVVMLCWYLMQRGQVPRTERASPSAVESPAAPGGEGSSGTARTPETTASIAVAPQTPPVTAARDPQAILRGAAAARIARVPGANDAKRKQLLTILERAENVRLLGTVLYSTHPSPGRAKPNPPQKSTPAEPPPGEISKILDAMHGGANPVMGNDPTLMVVALGYADEGEPQRSIALSQQCADATLKALQKRGGPALAQAVGMGSGADLPPVDNSAPTSAGASRFVEIWAANL